MNLAAYDIKREFNNRQSYIGLLMQDDFSLPDAQSVDRFATFFALTHK